MTRLPPDLDLIREALTPAAVHRRKARRLELLVVCIVLAAVLTVMFTKPSDAALKARFNTPVAQTASTYNHIADCKASLRGVNSDDDVHAWGAKTLAKRFVGWDVGGWHGADNSAYVVGTFEYSTGWIRWEGHCWGGDYRGDSF